MIEHIPMVDLVQQYNRLRVEIDPAIQEVLNTAHYIKGPKVNEFQRALEKYLDVKHVIGCANGTDALQIALMSLNLSKGDEVIVPAFTYAATAEVVALLGLKPVMVDVDPNTFNINRDLIVNAITENTKVIVPVHLFGQSSDMEELMELANSKGIVIIEDNAQAIGAECFYSNNSRIKCGTIGHIGTTSFFPSKNLGCFGDGGAIFTNDDRLAARIRMLANHGQSQQYHHEIVGVNSRLDAIQAAVLLVKLKHLNDFAHKRMKVADIYDDAFRDIEGIKIPYRSKKSTHVFHQYTVRIVAGKRDALQIFLKEKGIDSKIYYPVPLFEQNAFKHEKEIDTDKFANTIMLCNEVLSLPIHTEMKEDIQHYIIECVLEYFRQKIN